MAYLLDANVFIQAKNLHYGMDFCPAFWDWLVHANQEGKVFSVETVVTHEIASGSRKKVKIPDACISLGVKFMSPFTMLRRE